MAITIDLKGKVAVVSAGTQGIGLACARRLVAAGASVAICSRNQHHVRDAVSELKTQGEARVLGHTVDVTDEAAVCEWIDTVVKELGTVDIAVANAGGPPAGTFRELSLETWDQAYHLTFRSVLHLTRAVVPVMRRKQKGSIIAIESVSVRFPIEGLILSNAFRLGVVGMLKTLAGEVAQDGIRVNIVGPGYTATKRLKELAGRLADVRGVAKDDVIREWSMKIPIGRLAEPDEIANVVLFLASDLASYITGQVILVDGGLSPSP